MSSGFNLRTSNDVKVTVSIPDDLQQQKFVDITKAVDGDVTKTYKVANAVDDNDAVNYGQLKSKEIKPVFQGNLEKPNQTITNTGSKLAIISKIDNFNSFNNSTHEYTVPQSGFYFIYGDDNVKCDDGQWLMLRVSINGNYGRYHYNSATTGMWPQISMQETQYLNEGDIVYFVGVVGSGVSEWDSEYYGSFGLHKISD